MFYSKAPATSTYGDSGDRTNSQGMSTPRFSDTFVYERQDQIRNVGDPMPAAKPAPDATIVARDARRLSTLLEVSQALSGTLNLKPRRADVARNELSFICVPIVVQRATTGTLAVDLKFKAERDYESSVKFFGIVSSMIAQALNVQRLVEEERRRLVDENTHLRQELRERYDFSNIIGTSGPTRQMYEQVAQVAQ